MIGKSYFNIIFLALNLYKCDFSGNLILQKLRYIKLDFIIKNKKSLEKVTYLPNH